MEGNFTWPIDGLRGVILRAAQVIVVALLGALLDGTLLEGRVGQVGEELRAAVVSQGSSSKSSAVPVVLLLRQSPWA